MLKKINATQARPKAMIKSSHCSRKHNQIARIIMLSLDNSNLAWYSYLADKNTRKAHWLQEKALRENSKVYI